MKRIIGFSVLCLAAAMFVGSARADDPAPTPTLPTLATGTYVELAYDSLDAKKQDKLSNANNAGNNIAIDDNGKIGLDLAGLVNNDATPSEDGTYVLTIKVVNGAPVLTFEDIERTTTDE